MDSSDATCIEGWITMQDPLSFLDACRFSAEAFGSGRRE